MSWTVVCWGGLGCGGLGWGAEADLCVHVEGLQFGLGQELSVDVILQELGHFWRISTAG
jgi:hypothetical protein